tara:strand:+ start:262 stop:456 length:195 start_codon:yes stop_codon:yes gene_type:complete
LYSSQQPTLLNSYPTFKMDAKEVSTRIHSLQKALADKQPASVIITMLETLKKDVVPTEELLRVR